MPNFNSKTIDRLLNNRNDVTELTIEEIILGNGGLPEHSYSIVGTYIGPYAFRKACQANGYTVIAVVDPDGNRLPPSATFPLSNCAGYKVLLSFIGLGRQLPLSPATGVPHRRTNNRSQTTSLTTNPDLPHDIEKDERGVVLIKKSNVEKIRNTLSSHGSYRYTSAVDFIFKDTKPLTPKAIKLEQIIARLIIINQIDGTNLTTSFGADAFFRIAKSIYDNDFENLIANKQSIPNENFQNVAIRTSINNPEKKLKLFSVVTKYIARTAHYVYENDNNYPIYDSVLGSHLNYYFPIDISKTREECDYVSYCTLINEYLKSINKNLPADQKISNMDFDLIVWFSYKPANAPRKYD